MMSDIIEWIVVMDVNKGKAAQVQALVSEMCDATQADEPGAIHYEYFLNADKSRCTVLERYADNAAALVHLGHFATKFAERFFAIFTPVTFTVFGPSDAQLREALTPLGATFEDRIAGFAR